MTKQEIISLANAGFSAAQIAAIAAAPEQPAAAPAQPAQPAAAPAQPAAQTQPAAPAQPVAQAQPAPSVQDEILKQLGILTSAVQAGGIINSNQPQPQSADDILAEIIAPPNKSIQEVNNGK